MGRGGSYSGGDISNRIQGSRVATHSRGVGFTLQEPDSMHLPVSENFRRNQITSVLFVPLKTHN